jgi:hypothetical protein
MAQVIRTLCDVHLEQNEEVDATTWEVLVRRAGSRVQVREVDLCDECVKPLEAVASFAADKGRTSAQQARARTAVPTPSSVPPTSSSVTPSRQLVVAPNSAGEYQCPDCPRTFKRGQGLGAHRYQAHGYESPSRERRAS